MTDITLEQAERVLATALADATARGLAMNVAVVDAGANLKAFARQDGAWLGSVDISIKKARTARYFDMPTGDIGSLSQPGGPLFGIEVSNDGLISFPGGLPLTIDGVIVGAIGVSGSTVEDDHAVASAGAEALALTVGASA
ncbi:GlcG/HbpS family heme-binding protein [Arthrobacter cavernae]|uniref:Heme-binding protein n=1 Tax=Arthrobacter cavernae TaxID=2817681 RepID=A0A939HJQ6_9MICC|nr:heme-binding protein [Arthrobacter cavernae]MBO1269287.1 heme-binding protein [Arthrobacter cavernae]